MPDSALLIHAEVIVSVSLPIVSGRPMQDDPYDFNLRKPEWIGI